MRDQYKQKDFSRVQYNLLKYYSAFDVEIVAETFVRGHTYFPTEKIIRSIIGCKPFVLYGPKFMLTHLRRDGFRTFESCWDESYDKYEGVERWTRMQQTITQIHAWSDVEWSNIQQQAQDIAKHNLKNFKHEYSKH